MLSILLCFLLLHGVFSSQLSFQDVLRKDLEDSQLQNCGALYQSLGPMIEAKLIDASSKLITNGLLEGNFVDLGNYDECLSIENETKDVYGKYCIATVDIKKAIALLNSLQSNTTSVLLQQTQNKIDKLTSGKNYIPEITSALTLYGSFARFGICIPDKCNLKEVGLLKFDEAKCYTKFTNDEMDWFPFITLIILYLIILLAIVSTSYDVITENLSMKPKNNMLVAFSLYTNGKKLLSTQSSPNQLSCLHGIKVFSMVWVVLGHSYLNMLTTSIDNLFSIDGWLDNLSSMFILSATLSVDTFFTIGGLLTVYVYMRSTPVAPKDGLKQIPLLYLHRYLRLTPAFGIMVLLYASGLIKYLGDGPKWYTVDSALENCRENWWAALLYVQNYKNYAKMCVVQSWYLSADFQLFLITPFLLIPLRKWPKYIIPSLYIISVVGMIIPFIIGYSSKSSGIGYGSATSQFANQYYFVTHARFAPYFIGMIAGYYIYKVKKGTRTMRFERRYIYLLWLVVLIGLLGCIFDGFNLVKHTKNAWPDGLYMGFNRPAWSLCISLLIFLCSTGYGGPIQTFLSLPLFNVVGKLTYSMYIVHYIVILCVNGTSRTVFHFSNSSVVYLFCAYFTITLIISIFYSLIFESPMVTIEKIIFPSAKRRENHDLPK